MNFAEPWQLAWLALLPVLYWLALPPRPRQYIWTAHLAQWQDAHAALRRRPPRLSGLRWLCLAVACVLAVVAHAGPALPGAPGPQRLVVLLDASASMAARTAAGSGEGSSAFHAATARLRHDLAALPAHVDVTLLRCGGPLLRRLGPSARAVHDVGEPAGSLDVDLVDLAQRTSAPDTAVWTLTDGQGQAALPTTGALTVLSTAGANAAVLAVRTTDRWPLPRLDLEVDVIGVAEAVCNGELRLHGAIAAEPPRSVELSPGRSTTVRFELQRTSAGGELDLELVVPRDRLSADDHWRARLPALPAPRIAVLADAESGPFANVAAEALAAEVGGTVVAPEAGTEVGLLLVDGGFAPIEPGHVRAVCFGSQFAAARPLVPWLEPAVADWDRESPLTAGLDLSELRVQSAYREILPAGEAFLWALDAAGQKVPLAVVVGDDRLASVHFAFRLQDSNLPLLAAFPQLLRRAFVRAYGVSAQLTELTPAPSAGEQDLLARATAPDRALPAFGSPDRPLAALCLLVGLVALVVRVFLR